MTPQEFIYNFIEQLQKTEVEKPPEMVEYISALQTIADSDDKEAHERAMQNLLELGKKLVPAEQIEQKTVLPLAPDPDMAGTSPNYPIGKKENSTWVEIKRITGIIRQEYPKYKAPAMLGLQVGAIIVGVLWLISLYYAWGGVGTFDNSTTNDFRFLKFFHLDTLFVSLVIFRWALFTIIILSAITYFADELDTVKLFYRRFLVEVVIIFVLLRFLFGSSWTASNNLYLSGYMVALADILSFLGWSAICGLIVYVIFQRANVGSEAKLYFATFGIELVINTIRLYFIFIVLYIPIFIGVVIYIAYNNADKTWANVPYEVAGFWGWWIPAILGSINLAMSLGIFFGWNAPVSGIKLSFDSRDMTSEEKDYMIRFYRRLVESGRGNEQVFKSWNIIESSGIFAFTYGANIFISRGSFTERYFNALVAHEIGHLHNRDGLVLQALHSFTYPLFNHLLFNPTTIQKGVIEQDKDFNKPNSLLSGIISSMTITFFTLIFGGWSVQALARFWSRFYIERDYLADDYACELGFAGELLNYLDSYKDFDTALPLFNRWRGYTRVRIERIRTKIEMSY